MYLSHLLTRFTMFLALCVAVASFALLSFTGIAASAAITHSQLLMKKGRPSATASIPNCDAWTVISSPNLGTRPTVLTGVTAISRTVWAVGYSANNNSSKTVIERWNGTNWSIVPSPRITGNYGYLWGVKAITANNVWAVGSYLPSTSQTLIEHWDGTSWSIVPSPNVNMVDNYLSAIATVSASNIWAAGYYLTTSGVAQTLIEHWNGTSWSIIPSPNSGSGNNYLNAVAYSSSSDVWAVGTFYPAGGDVAQTLIEHWNGVTWSIIHSPNAGSLGSYLTGVTTVSASDAWVVGSYTVVGNPSNYEQTLIEHWDGTVWNIISSPNVGSNWNVLHAVKAVSASNVWAVGYDIQNNDRTLIEQWNGTGWNVVASPNTGYDDFLNAVTQVPGTNDMWTVGSYYPTLHNVSQSLTEFYC